jgi:hypothetical protein
LKGGGRRRRLFFGSFLVSIAALAALFISNAFAVHDLVFQLDGDVSASTTTNVGGHVQSFDWDSFFNSAGQPSPVLPDASRPGFTASGFDRDFNTNANGSFNTSDTTTFTQGSKDILNPATGWACAFSNNVNSKVDIMNDYAVAYTDPNTGHQILYFSLERNDNAGDGNVGFWFLQNDVGCSTASGTASFTGNHADGDLLIVSAFTTGGTVSTITVYRWNGGANGSLGTNPVVTGVDCKTTGGTDSACATVNGPTNGIGGTITTPWLTASKGLGVGHSLQTSEFFEGGLDLTKSNLGGKCFNFFIGDTRSSQSLTATLFDFARGKIGECTSTTTTTPKESDGITTITSDPIPATGTLDVTDSAKIDVTGIGSFNGTVTYFLCRSSELDANGQCSTGGTQIGAAKPVTTPGQVVVSDKAGLTAADHYCWRAVFSGDATAGVPGSSDSAKSECFDVTPLQPALTTQASAGPVDFGSKISDTISLLGTANAPGTNGIGPGGTINATDRAPAGGTINVTAFGPNDCTTSAHTASIAASGDNAAYGGAGSSTEFTPTAPGTYTYVASYTGQSPNTLKVAATACPDPSGAEAVVVRQIPTQISTAQTVFPEDSATITSSVAGNNLPTGGTVVFRLYGPTGGATPQTALQNCQAHGDTLGSGGLLYKETQSNVGGTHSATVGTSNTTVSVNSNDTFYWRVTYATGDTAHLGSQSDCVENVSTAFINDSGPGSLFP